MELLLTLGAMLLLLVLKGFFSGSEIALVNADKMHLHHQANQGRRGARLILDLFQRPEILLGTTLVGTNISTIVLTTMGTVLMIETFGPRGDLLAFLLFTPVFLILGEIVPKSVYQQKSDSLAPIIVFPLRWFSILFAPIIFIFSRVASWAARIAGGGKTASNLFITREQIRSVLEMSERSTAVDQFDRGRIKRAIRFSETTVGEAMVPAAEITAINKRQTTREAISLVRRHGFNRLPVYEHNINHIFGVVTLSTWDLMDPDLKHTDLKELIKPAYFVSTHQTIDQLMPVLQQREDHMAIVVDEFGSAVGMITIEDILEEVVGEIDMGFDFEEYLPKKRAKLTKVSDDVFIVDSRLPISEVNDLLGLELPSKESHTVGGLVMARLRHIPSPGESIVESGCRFVVEQASERSVEKLRIERLI
jgi:CBS domain containing-hemolysin-like protein